MSKLKCLKHSNKDRAKVGNVLKFHGGDQMRVTTTGSLQRVVPKIKQSKKARLKARRLASLQSATPRYHLNAEGKIVDSLDPETMRE